MRSSIFYQPLAVFLAVIMLPPFSWITGASPFEAAAQAPVVCGPSDSTSSTRQIVNTCPWTGTGTGSLPQDLIQFQDETIATYLKDHKMPADDASDIFDYGRAGLRSEIRSEMESRMMDIIKTPRAQRKPFEQVIYEGMQRLLQPTEIQYLTAVTNEWNRFRSNPCTFTLDPDVAAVNGLTYDGTKYCFPGSLDTLFGTAIAPGANYFKAVGLKSSYGKLIQDRANGAVLVQNGVKLAATLSAVLGAAAGTALLVAVNFASLSAAGGAAAAASAALASGTLLNVTAETAEVLIALAPQLSRVFAGGASAGVTVAVIVGSVQGFQVFNDQAQINELNSLSASLAAWQNAPQDLDTFLTDANGLFRFNAALTALTTPDAPSTAAPPLHRPGIDAAFIPYFGGGGPSEEVTYYDWFNFKWKLTTYKGWFFSSRTGADGTQYQNLTPTIYYKDTSGNSYIASRAGSRFVVTKGAPAATDTVCKADPVTGISPGDIRTCSTYVTTIIALYGFGDNPSQAWSLAVPPSFTSAPSAGFAPGVAKTFDITASGDPAASISQTGTLPAGLSFTAGNPAKLSGTAAAGTEGAYPITLTAQNTGGKVTQNFVLNVGTLNLTFTSPAETTLTLLQPSSFTVRTTGNPKPSLSLGAVPAGMTFIDNGDGTATLSGKPTALFAPGTIPPCPIGGCGVTATNAFGSVYQNLKVYVAPVPTIISSSPSGLAFTVTKAGDYCNSIGSYSTSKELRLFPINDISGQESCAVKFEPTIDGAPGTRYVFEKWNDGPSAITRTFVMPAAPTTYTANFTTQNYLTTSAGPGGSIGPASMWFSCGALCNAIVDAVPAPGYAFTGYSGDLTGGPATQQILMTAPHSVKANFAVVTGAAVAPQAGKYSETVNLTAGISASNAALNAAVAGVLQFTVNGANAGAPVTVNGAGTYTVPYAITQAAGTYPLSAVFTGGAGVLGASASNLLTVTGKTTSVIPVTTNATTVQVSGAGLPGSFQLSFTIGDGSGGSTGGIAQTTPITVTLNGLVAAPVLTCPVTTSVSGGILTAVATCSNVPVNVYEVTTTIGGGYYAGSSTSIIAVFDPSLGDVNGAGKILRNGQSASFGVNVKYKKGLPDGAVAYTGPGSSGNEIKVKSTSIQSMAIAGNTAVILGQATVGGVENYSFQATAIGNGTSESSDLFGLKVTDPSGRAVPELSFSPVNLTSGKIKVPK